MDAEMWELTLGQKTFDTLFRRASMRFTLTFCDSGDRRQPEGCQPGEYRGAKSDKLHNGCRYSQLVSQVTGT